MIWDVPLRIINGAWWCMYDCVIIDSVDGLSSVLVQAITWNDIDLFNERNSNIFIRENAFECVTCIFLYRRQFVECNYYDFSAGVGRTGTFLAVDYLLEQAKAEGIVDVLRYTCLMRSNRMNMIQTKVRLRNGSIGEMKFQPDITGCYYI